MSDLLNAMEDDDFRMLVREWIEANYPPEIRNPAKRLHWSECSVWYMKLAEKGWLCPSWPQEYGGMGLTPAKQIIMIDEMERHGCARTVDQGVLMIGPLIIAHGSQAQKDTYLPKILPESMSGARATVSRTRVPTSRRCARGPIWTAITTSSTARKSGPRWRWTRT